MTGKNFKSCGSFVKKQAVDIARLIVSKKLQNRYVVLRKEQAYEAGLFLYDSHLCNSMCGARLERAANKCLQGLRKDQGELPMFDKKASMSSTLLRGWAIVNILVVLMLLLVTYLFSSPRLEKASPDLVKNAVIDLSSYSFSDSQPVFLNGDWEYFPGVFMEKDKFNPEQLISPQTITLPIASLPKSTETASYRIKMRISAQDDLMLYFPTVKSDIHVFLNGVAQYAAPVNSGWTNFSVYDSLFYLEDFNNTLDEQEIVISVNRSGSEAALYRRPIIISTVHNIITHAVSNIGNEMLMLGLLLLIIVSGYIFMYFRPSHQMITYMTLFDTMLMVRVISGLDNAMAFFQSMIPKLVITDAQCLSIQIFSLMLGGFFGIRLSHYIYDPENKTPRILSILPSGLYLLFAVVFPLNLELFDKIGMQSIMAVLLFTLFGVCYQAVYRLRRQCTPYFILQLVKTGYVGLIVFFDILTINKDSNYFLFAQLYGFFFLVHVAIRLYDNNNSYKDVEVLNQTLESTVIERTRQLSQANRILSELSVRDPLTKVHNRLYFEQQMEKKILEFNAEKSTMHLCLFDLDHFKTINDTYGHAAGDDQLCNTTAVIYDNIGENCMLSRVGGEEFTILYCDYTDEEVLENVEQIRAELEKQAKQDKKRTTASFGITRYQPGMTLRDLLKCADRNMYAAKHDGRNRIVFEEYGKEHPVVLKEDSK